MVKKPSPKASEPTEEEIYADDFVDAVNASGGILPVTELIKISKKAEEKKRTEQSSRDSRCKKYSHPHRPITRFMTKHIRKPTQEKRGLINKVPCPPDEESVSSSRSHHGSRLSSESSNSSESSFDDYLNYEEFSVAVSRKEWDYYVNVHLREKG